MESQARVVIVGGGMMGAGLLYHLALEGWQDCLLIEKAELTSGSTWHAAGQCPHFNGDFNLAKIHHYGIELYPKLEAITGQYAGWHGCGGLRLAVTEEELAWFKHVQGIAKTIGYALEVIGPNEIKRYNPFLELDGVLAAAWTPHDGHVDPAGSCNAMIKGARDLGAKISLRNRVLDIERRGDEWAVISEAGTVRCEHVVNAAGCYAREVAAMISDDARNVLPITNMLHHYLVTEPIREFIDRDEELPVMRDPYPSAYYRQEQKAGLIGIYESNCAEAWTEQNGSPHWEAENELFSADLDRIEENLTRTFERMPIFAEAGLKRIVHGAIPHTPDANPLLGPVGGVENAWNCCGSSIGIAQGAGCGKYLAQWMVHGDAEINMMGFDSRRFGAYADIAYTKAKSFQDYGHMYAPHLPGEQRPAARPARTSPLYETLKTKGAIHTEAFGWERPAWFDRDGRGELAGWGRRENFAAIAGECKAVHEAAGIMDLSSFAKFMVSGKDADAYLNRLFANTLPKRIGGIGLMHRLSTHGRIQSEVTISKLAEEQYYVLSGAAWEIRDFDALKHAVTADDQVVLENCSNDYGILLLAGPNAREILAKVTDHPLDNQSFPWLRAQQIAFAKTSIIALRVNYVGELGWELHCPMDHMAQLYQALMTAGSDLGLTDFGAEAMNAMRMEKAYRGIGADMTNEITLIEAGMQRFMKKSDTDYIGRQATETSEPTTQLIYGSVAADHADCHGGEPVFLGDQVVGVTTSGGYGHRVGKSLFFAYVTPAAATAAQGLQVQLLGELCAVEVLSQPAFDPQNARLRA